MDYSLLLAIEKDASVGTDHRSYNNSLNTLDLDDLTGINDALNTTSFIKSNHCFQKETKIFHISIIDYLQEWNLQKKMERLSKTLVLGKDGKNLSAIEPNEYANRFRNFMESNVLL